MVGELSKVGPRSKRAVSGEGEKTKTKEKRETGEVRKTKKNPMDVSKSCISVFLPGRQ